MPPIELADEQAGAAVAAQSQDAVSTALAEVTTTNETITEHVRAARDLAERFKGVAFDVRTVKGMDDACKARAAIREHRYAIDKLKKAGSKLLGSMQRQFNGRADELIGEIEGYEKPIHEQIQAEELRKAAERAEREAAEARRRQGHIDAIAAISRMVAEAAGLDSTALAEKIATAEQIIVDKGYEEFEGQALQARDETIRQLRGMHVAALAEEAELEEARQAKAQLERQRAEQAEREAALAARERELAEREAAQKAEAERLERARAERAQAVQSRIVALRTCGPLPLGEAPADLIASAIRTLQAAMLTEELLDDRVQEAGIARAERLRELEEAHAAAVEREAEEARQKQAARVQELIDTIRGMGENALLAVQDGSAELEGLRTGLAELEGLELTELDGREEEAERARAASIAATKEAIAATEERDRREAEEAAARALVDAKRSWGEQLYELVRRSIVTEVFPTEEATAMLLQINPEEDFDA
jgi:hypothetical protein